jgi:hypothetical protein
MAERNGDMQKLREASELFARQRDLQKQAFDYYVEIGRLLNEVDEILKRQETPEDRYVDEIKAAHTKARSLEIDALKIQCQAVALLEELADGVKKTQFRDMLNGLGITPGEFRAMQSLADQWGLFEQALTWESDIVEAGGTYVAEELYTESALKLIKTMLRKRRKPDKPDPRNMSWRQLLGEIAKGNAQLSRSNRESYDNTWEYGELMYAAKQRLGAGWLDYAREQGAHPEDAKLALLFYEHKAAIEQIIAAGVAKAVAAGLQYYYPTRRDLLRRVHALPPLPNGGIVGEPDDEFLDRMQADLAERGLESDRAAITQLVETARILDPSKAADIFGFLEREYGVTPDQQLRIFGDSEWVLQIIGILPPSPPLPE